MNVMQKFILLAIFSTTAVAFAQNEEFGQNKVQYGNFDWYFIQTKHFDIYFYPKEYQIAEFAAHTAEAAYAHHSALFHYDITNRIPYIVYDSHDDWQQTNVISEYLEEGVGGVTEQFKNRIVVPFEGSYELFRHVIAHELVHAIFNDMYYGGSVQSMIANNITMQLPMWFNEGMAEFASLDWEMDSDMFMLDATVNEYMVPIDELYGYFAYRGGQSIWWYIANKYGREKIAEILSRIRSTRSVEQGFKSALGISIKELSKRWTQEQKVMYWPDVALYKRPEDFAKRLTDHKEMGNFYNTSPSISPQGDKIALISDKDEYMSIYLMDANDGKFIKKLVDGQTTKDFEELHLLTPALSWSPDEKKIAIAVKSGSHDAINIIDVQSSKVEEIPFPNLEGVFSVSWSPDGEKLAFVGDNNTQSDVYIYDLKNKVMANLTDDIFSDYDPSWSPDGKTIYFVSDRGDYLNKNEVPKNFKMWNYDYKQAHIYSLNVASKMIERLTGSRIGGDTYPIAAPDGKHLYYVSDRTGISNLYYMDLSTDSSRPVTNSINGIYQFSISKDGSRLAFSSLDNGGFDVFLLKGPNDNLLTDAQVPLTSFAKQQLAELTASKTTVEGRAGMGLIGTTAMALSAKNGIQTADSIASDSNKVKDLYGKNIQVDLSNYVFGKASNSDSLFSAPEFNDNFNIKNNVDSAGDYIAQKYKVNFTPDIIYGNAGYNTFFGVQGGALMAFSDMLGNQQIYLLTDLLIDLKNSDYAFEYDNLASRINYSVLGMHLARFLYLTSPYDSTYDLYRFQSYGLTLSSSYPLDKYNRLETGLSWLGLTRENLDNTAEPSQDITLIVPSFRYVHDNSFFGYIAPINGSRYYLSLYGSPKLGSQGISFATAILDYRDYIKLFSTFYTFAWRVFAGTSVGANPQEFFIGGTENWINAQFDGDFIPIRNAQDLQFLTPVVPMRGYDYNAEFGNNFTLVNMELRFPMFGFLEAGPVPLFESLFGAAFVDVGSAWGWNNYPGYSQTAAPVYQKFQAFDHDSSGNLETRDLLIGTGFGARMVILGFLLRLDIGWAYNIQNFSPPHYYFSLGYDY
ncbi:MAG: biopolymer transporter Tol [Candidatus Kryptoniota bacterium]